MESTPQQTADGKSVVAVLAAVLDRLVERNTQTSNYSNGTSPEVTKFHALKAPGISIQQYLERIHKYASCSTECFILALIYIDRLIQTNNFILSELNVHRVVITAILLAAKFFDDAYYNNAYYAKVGGVVVAEMNGLEVEFLFRINFSLHVKPDVFTKYQEELASHAIGAGLEQPIMKPAEKVLNEVHEKQHQQAIFTPVVEISHKVSPQIPCSESSTTQFSQGPLIETYATQQPNRDVPFDRIGAEVKNNKNPPADSFTGHPEVVQNLCNGTSNNNDVTMKNGFGEDPATIKQDNASEKLHNYHYIAPSPPESPKKNVCNPMFHHKMQGAQQQHQQTSPYNNLKEQSQNFVSKSNNQRRYPTKINQYQINSNNFQRIHPSTDILFNTCCPYGRRLSPNATAPEILNSHTTSITVRGLYQ